MNLKDSLDKKIFTTIGAIADSMGRECYAVGGYVRDIIIGRPSKDRQRQVRELQILVRGQSHFLPR